ncbi:MAG: tetratricopeptide repeat protein [Anaerolineae bacterium]|nr:tetratricopeptide repeat protein [Anaerolineae bacterium]
MATEHPLRTWQQALWLLIALIIPLFVNFWVEQQFEASKVWLLRSLIWVLVVLWLSGWLRGLQPKPLPTPIRNLVIILTLVLLLSTLLSTHQTIALFGSLDRAGGVLTQIAYLLLFVCVATQIDGHQSRQLLMVMVITAVPISILGLAQAAGWQPLPLFTDARTPLTTTLGRANFTGAYLALLLPLTLIATQTAVEKWQRVGFGILFGLELVVIAITQARAAWITAVVGLLVLLWLQVVPSWSRRNRWLRGLGGLALLTGALLLILQRGIAAGDSIAARWTIWQASLRLLWPRLWLGYGADTLDLHFPSVYPPQLVYYQGRGVVVDRAHNWLLDWSLNYGVVATVIFILLVVFVLRLGWQQLADPSVTSPPNSQTLASPWVAASMAALCAHLVGNLFLFDVAATAVLFWLLMAIVVAGNPLSPALSPKGRGSDRPLSLSGGGLGWGLIFAFVLLAGWAIWQANVRPMLADAHSWRGTQALAQGDFEEAMVEYETAVSYQPKRAEYQVALALTLAQTGNFAPAEAAMHQAIALHPTDPVLHTQLAAIYARQAGASPEKIEAAYNAYEQAIALAPTIGLTHQQYADLALRTGDIESARRQAQRAVDLDATDGLAFGILGWAALQHNDLAASQQAFEQAIKWQPDSADFHLGLATVYAQQGNQQAAHQTMQQSLILDPDYPPTLALQQQLLGN